MRSNALCGWRLFWLLVIPMNAGMLAGLTRFELGSPEGLSQMIQYSVRWAVPFIYLVTAASAMPVLFPGQLSRWWRRNRRYLGLVFAVAMAWQAAFIFVMSTLHTGYYYEDVYLLRDEIEGSSGYIFLTAMVFTSFGFGRQLLTSAQWTVLHRCGVYFLWAYPFSVYWWNIYYYKTGAAIDYLFYWAGFLAFAARIAAWGTQRRQSTQDGALRVHDAWLWRALGFLCIAAGLLASATGQYWQAPVSAALTAASWAATLEIWLPFWPFEPFLPLAAVGLGAYVFTGNYGRAQQVGPLARASAGDRRA